MSDDSSVLSLATQGGITLVGEFVGLLVGFSFLIMVTRLVDPTAYGTFSLALSIVLLFQAFDLSIDDSVDYFVPMNLEEGRTGKVKSVLVESLKLGLVGSGTATVLVFLAAPPLADAFGTSKLTPVLRVLALIIPLQLLLKVSSKYFNSTMETQYRVLTEKLIRPVSKITITGFLLLIVTPTVSLVAGYVTAIAFAVLVAAVLILRSDPKFLSAERQPVDRRRMVNYSLPLAFGGITWLVVGQIDFILLGFFRSTKDVATYRIVFRLMSNLPILITAFNPVFKPMIARRKDNSEETKELYRLATRWALILILPVGIVLAIAPISFVSVLFTETYVGAGITGTVLIAGYIVKAASGPTAMFLSGIGRPRFSFLNLVLYLVVNLTLGVLLVPRLGPLGAAIGTAVGITAQSIAGVIEVYYFRGFIPLDMSIVRTWVSAAFTAIPVFAIGTLVHGRWVHFLTLPVVSLGVFILLVFLSGALSEDDLVIASYIDEKLDTDKATAVARRAIK